MGAVQLRGGGGEGGAGSGVGLHRRPSAEERPEWPRNETGACARLRPRRRGMDQSPRSAGPHSPSPLRCSPHLALPTCRTKHVYAEFFFCFYSAFGFFLKKWITSVVVFAAYIKVVPCYLLGLSLIHLICLIHFKSKK